MKEGKDGELPKTTRLQHQTLWIILQDLTKNVRFKFLPYSLHTVRLWILSSHSLVSFSIFYHLTSSFSSSYEVSLPYCNLSGKRKKINDDDNVLFHFKNDELTCEFHPKNSYITTERIRDKWINHLSSFSLITFLPPILLPLHRFFFLSRDFSLLPIIRSISFINDISIRWTAIKKWLRRKGRSNKDGQRE